MNKKVDVTEALSAFTTLVFFPLGIWLWDRHLKKEKFTGFKLLIIGLLGYAFFSANELSHVFDVKTKLITGLFSLNLIAGLYQAINLIENKGNINKTGMFIFMAMHYLMILMIIVFVGFLLLFLGLYAGKPPINKLLMLIIGYVMLVITHIFENRKYLNELPDVPLQKRVKISLYAAFVLTFSLFIFLVYILASLYVRR